jgi:hypothetical protein
MNVLWRCFTIVHALMAALFTVAALMLIAIAARTGWAAFAGQWDQMSAQSIIEAIGLLAGAVVAIQIAVFVHLNRSAEELEPEAMEKAKREDAKVQ